MQYKTNSLENQWLPFTANRDFKNNPRMMVKAEGVYYWDHKGGKVMDGSSGMFCCAAGHSRPEIADAVHKQLQEVAYVPPFQNGHPASFELANRVTALTPDEINHVFFTNSGSESVDTALKIAMAYHRANGQGERIRFVSRERAYHGVNIGGTSLSGLMRNREKFSAVMPGVIHMRHTWDPDQLFQRGQPENGWELANDLQRAVDNVGASSIAACFVEPIAGSTGVLVPPKGYLERLRAICDAHGILLVFDEVICGFGRLGTAFAAGAFGVTPDLMTMAKGLTNGAIPMGAVAVRDFVYDTIVGAAEENAIEFFHGYTYSAHPAACAAGLATMDIYENEGLFDKAAKLAPYFLDQIFELQKYDCIKDIRGFGLLAAVELKPGKDGAGALGGELQKDLFWSGLHVKFTGDTAIIAPPLIATEAHVDELISKLETALQKI